MRSRPGSCSVGAAGGSLLALARMSSRHTVMLTGPGARPDLGAGVAGARIQHDPVGAAIEVDVLVFTPAG